jgi:hypothetical protein
VAEATKVVAAEATVAEAVTAEATKVAETVAATKAAETVAATKEAIQVATKVIRTAAAHGPSAKRLPIGHAAETTVPTRSTAVQATRRSAGPTASHV